jgi:hypothetical protein
MNPFFYTGALGWFATILVATETLLPYLLRRTTLSEWSGTADRAGPYLQRMWGHYWIGYLLLPMAFVHAWIPMRAGQSRGANVLGLWIATASFLLLFLQAVLGLVLKGTTVHNCKRARRIHYWTMMGIVLTVAAHIWLNG